jgi:TM2 domain-containing membrane protein YozV
MTADLTPSHGSPAVPPPSPLNQEWFLHAEGETFGPYSGHAMKEHIASGRVTRSSLVARAGGNQWVEARQDPILAPLFPPPATNPAGTAATITGNSGPVVQIHQNFGPAAVPVYSGDIGPKSPALALVLSLIICGVGQFYNGQIGKGIAMLLLCIALWFVFLGWIINIWSIIDAYTSAKAINARFNAGLVRPPQPL